MKEKEGWFDEKIVVDMQNFLFGDSIAIAFKNSNYDIDVLRAETPQDIYAKHNQEVLYQSGGKSALTNCKPSSGGNVAHDSSIDKTDSNCGINVSYNGELSLYNIIVKNNHSGTKQTAGGGIYASTGTVKLYNCTVKDNTTSVKGGGIGAVNRSNVSIYGGEISGNTSKESAGGIYVGSNTTVNIEGTTINNNTADGTAGGVYGDNNSTVNINNAT